MNQIKQKVRKRDRVKNALKSTKDASQNLGNRVLTLTRSRVVKRFLPLFGLVLLFKPSPSYAISLADEGFQFGKNATIISAEYRGLREITKHGVSAITDPTLRSAVTTSGSIAALLGGVGCGVGSAVCAGMGYEQKAMICLHGVGICAGIATGLNEADPLNPVTIPGRVLGGTVEKMSA